MFYRWKEVSVVGLSVNACVSVVTRLVYSSSLTTCTRSTIVW